MQQMKTILVTTVAFLILDFFWLGLLMSDFYKTQLGTLARRNGETLAPIWWAAGLVYVLIPIGIAMFVIPRAGSSPSVAAWGALFGVIVYGVYDLTNYSTLAGWSFSLVIVDILWGAIISALAATAGHLVS
jgi:uncharacterized membrane protein